MDDVSDEGVWAAVVLTGGTGSRMGGTDKAGLSREGRRLLDLAVEAVAGATETVVVGPRAPTERPVTFTREEPPGGGPLAGLSAGVAALTGGATTVVVVAVDMPHLTGHTVSRLVAAAREGSGAWLVDPSGRRQLAGAVRRDRVPRPEAATGLPMRVLMDDPGAVDVSPDGSESADVDTWDDAARWGVRATRCRSDL